MAEPGGEASAGRSDPASGVHRVAVLASLFSLVAFSALVAIAAASRSPPPPPPPPPEPAPGIGFWCELRSNGVELAAHYCTLTGVDAGVDLSAVTATLTGNKSELLGIWRAPIAYDGSDYSQADFVWSPLDTNTLLEDDGDGIFGVGDVFHLECVQGYRFDGATFSLQGGGADFSIVLE